MDVRNEQTTYISIGSATELRDLTISRSEAMQNHWRSADKRFKTVFEANPFGLSCSVCDRLWFERDLKKAKHCNISFLQTKFPDENVTEFRLCSTCSKSIDANKIPTLSRSNGFRYPPKPSGLPLLDPISIRLISPRLPFMQIRRLRYEGNYGIVGQVINVPVDVNNMVQQLPRWIDDGFAFNVNIKNKLIHKSNYLSGFVRKSVNKAWLRYLVNQPLYKYYNIKIDWSVFDKDMDDYIGVEFQIESVDPDFAPESEILLARQHTLLWNEEQCLDIALGQNSSPINIIYDVHGEELSFPQIYYGVPRQFDLNVRVTPYMMATSELRHTDLRGATPDHVPYMAMKMLRIRVVKVDTELHSILDDSQKDLFAMLRQLGKPTVFFTISANEIKWPKLLKILHDLSDSFKDIHVEDPLVNLNRSQRSHLVNEDPVTCCVYFNKLVDTIMAMLQAKMTYNPFGLYRVLDYFLRIEFQHRSSPHAHVLLWLENDPHEKSLKTCQGLFNS
ncbi:uncharacterized protein TNCV_4175361 [Trichonephila clavipes]|nr:uncharacterized protein TNCV_4175361 [Trichonephila clavipes]